MLARCDLGVFQFWLTEKQTRRLWLWHPGSWVRLLGSRSDSDCSLGAILFAVVALPLGNNINRKETFAPLKKGKVDLVSGSFGALFGGPRRSSAAFVLCSSLELGSRSVVPHSNLGSSPVWKDGLL